MDEHCNDPDLISGLKAGEQKYLIIFVDRFAKRLLSFVMGRGFSRSDAEEVVSDTIYKAIRHINEFEVDGNTKFFTWLAAIACNGAADLYRRKARSPESESIEERAARGIGDPEGSTRKSNVPDSGKKPLSQKILSKALRRLSPAVQRILMARTRGYQHKEIAEWLDKSEGAVKVAYHRGLEKLRAEYINLLEELEDEAEKKGLKTYLNIGYDNEKAAS